ncbi:MAG: potassium-transporting ATPase subunit KdpC [Anaerolineae bacterium]|uniref:potassium-transporting ATPase subunit KdpC n=1 Tax=Promineifilum sp. TaxID=2664178 RepID=UPI001D24D5B6|nr:potassium-transporting ATPase subunit KdpC [Anaerolineales bacterium]MCB8933991.1 potassium-transporting ATPase subunit KdpC [Promineifilum sp.]MCO5179390.1 potassium-transporting ATPase subunit KdpC [Promineifilum sp.]MCW5845894.1 potassium-transporting ATPase subunit KdpC [Anaerolineae bacterium]
MVKQLRPAVFMLVILTLITGIIYPLVVTGIAQVLFPSQANGSLLGDNAQPLGSALVGQANNDSRYFWPRPSATGYGTLPSGGSNLGPTSAALAELVGQRATAFRIANGLATDASVPVEMLFASASGLDPHISPEAARMQVARVAAARGLDVSRVAVLVEEHVEGPQLGFLGQPRVNVLLLNMTLDRLQ